MVTLGEVLVKLTGDASGLRRAVDTGKRALNEIPGAAQSSLGQTTHVSRFGTVLGSLGSTAATVGRSLASVAVVGAGAFAALTVGAAALASRLTGPTIRAMADLKHEAYALGTSAESLSRLQAAARLVGVEVEQLRAGVGQLAAKLEEARDPSSQAAVIFERLGIDIRQGVVP